MKAQNCYALMVGIDKYQAPVPPLDGCVNDMRAMRDFLIRSAEATDTPLHMEVLENEKATRLNIVRQFEKHLARAEAGDVAFFYYSGHGSQEPTHEIFYPIEEDKKNETLVCYDSRSPDGMDLADKELATLLDLVADSGAHVVVVLDCCNSGSGTRDLSEVSVRQVNLPPNRTRSLDDYILPKKADTNATRSLEIASPDHMIVPEPRHVALSAAQSFQLAKETLLGGTPRGVFTYSLLEVLEQAVGPMTYQDVMRRVRALVQQRTFEQTPQMYAQHPPDINLVFLNGTATLEVNYYALSFDREKGWTLDAGSVHGIVGGLTRGGNTLFYVFAEDAPAKELEDPRLSLGRVRVVEVLATHSRVQPEGNLFLDKKTVYRARLHSMAVPTIDVSLQGESRQAIERLQDAIQKDAEARSYVNQVSTISEADYVVTAHHRPDSYLLRRQTDASDQPLVPQTADTTDKDAARVIDQLVHIGRWEHILHLSNPGSALPSESIITELMKPHEDTPILPGNLGVVFRYSADSPKEELPRFRVRITNKSHQRLYVSLLFLSAHFGIETRYIADGGVWLDPGAHTWLRGGVIATATIDNNLIAIGKRQVENTFKVIFANEEFDSERMQQPELGLPRPTPRKAEENSRALVLGNGAANDMTDWNTNQITYTIIQEETA